MVAGIQVFSIWSLQNLEASMLPTRGDLPWRVATYVCQFFQFCVFLPTAVLSSSFSAVVIHLFASKQKDTPLVEFAKNPQFADELRERAPVSLGAATAEFQDEGPNVHPKTQFGKLYHDNPELLATVGEPLDVWNHPKKVIARLKELKFTAYRFSVSRDKIEPELGKFDESAIIRYANFCRELTRNGICPMVTLDHFTHPLYFSWDKKEDIEGFVNYARKIGEALYTAGVRRIVTINEPTVMGFQGWVMGDFPPHKKLDFEGCCRVLENMLQVHQRIYIALKLAHPDFEVGITHDPIRFRNFHKYNPILAPLERMVCHYLTEVTHSAFFRCLQTGKFSLKVPFRTNYQFSMEKPKLDFIGLQYYSDPLLNLLRGSVARTPDQDLTSYEYRTYPQGLSSAIEECSTLGVPVDLTEIGIDIGINREASDDKRRIRYFNRIFQVVEKALAEGKQVRSLYFWTLIDNLEWHKGWTIPFGLYGRTPEGKIEPRGITTWLQSLRA